MIHRHVCLWGAAASISAFLLVLWPQSASAQESAQAAAKDLVLREDAQCTRCHDDEDNPRVVTIGKTKHGTRADARTPTCISCHGPSELHANKPAALAERPKPDRVFGKNSTIRPEQRTDTCMACHQGKERMFWATSPHAAADVTCDTCHEIHNDGRDKVRERAGQMTVCFECHKTQRIQVSKPYSHPIQEGKVVCSDCHNPHGSAGFKNLARDTVNDTCFQCHAEKRGPFVWNHQPVTENCAICHEPHGTTVANLLKWRQPFLCQQCHEPGTHQGAAPGFFSETGTQNARAVLFARGCVNCHTNIHGSNNPSNASGSRSFRQ